MTISRFPIHSISPSWRESSFAAAGARVAINLRVPADVWQAGRQAFRT